MSVSREQATETIVSVAADLKGRLGMSEDGIGRVLGVSRITLHSWRTGKHPVGRLKIKRYADRLRDLALVADQAGDELAMASYPKDRDAIVLRLLADGAG